MSKGFLNSKSTQTCFCPELTWPFHSISYYWHPSSFKIVSSVDFYDAGLLVLSTSLIFRDLFRWQRTRLNHKFFIPVNVLSLASLISLHAAFSVSIATSFKVPSYPICDVAIPLKSCVCLQFYASPRYLPSCCQSLSVPCWNPLCRSVPHLPTDGNSRSSMNWPSASL